MPPPAAADSSPLLSPALPAPSKRLGILPKSSAPPCAALRAAVIVASCADLNAAPAFSEASVAVSAARRAAEEPRRTAELRARVTPSTEDGERGGGGA